MHKSAAAMDQGERPNPGTSVCGTHRADFNLNDLLCGEVELGDKLELVRSHELLGQVIDDSEDAGED